MTDKETIKDLRSKLAYITGMNIANEMVAKIEQKKELDRMILDKMIEAISTGKVPEEYDSRVEDN